MTGVLPADDYEELVKTLMTQLAAVREVTTDRLDRPEERIPGATGTTHQIDVLWDFTASDGTKWRVLFEARSYKSRLKQSAVFAFAGVVADIDELCDRQCLGVMVTATGFQRGAQLVGDSLGVLLLELRKPTDVDMRNRIQRVALTAVARTPFVNNVKVQFYEGSGEEGLTANVEIEYPDGARVGLGDMLLAGRLKAFGTPPWRETVRRDFGREHRLLADGVSLGELEVIVADIGESEVETSVVVGGRDQIAWMLAQATGGFRVWFAANGRQWTTS